MTTLALQEPTHQTHPDAFAFVQELASELSNGKVDLPSFPEIAVRVRQVLSDELVTPDKVVRVVGSEPALAARLLQIANSAALNFSGRAVTELRTAVARMGFNMVRSAAIAFAMSQLKQVNSLKGLEKPLEVLWNHAARRLRRCPTSLRAASPLVNPDMALLSRRSAARRWTSLYSHPSQQAPDAVRERAGVSLHRSRLACEHRQGAA